MIVDLQNDYCHPDGAMAQMGNDVSACASAAVAAEALLTLARRHDVPCVLVRTTHGPWSDTPGWRSRGAGGGLLEVDRVPLCVEGTWGVEFYGITPRPSDLVITKHRYSGFAYTALELALRAKEREVVLFAGTMTNACVEATAVDAVIHGFGCVLVADASATAPAAAQIEAERKFASLIGPVHTGADIAAAWG